LWPINNKEPKTFRWIDISAESLFEHGFDAEKSFVRIEVTQNTRYVGLLMIECGGNPESFK